MKNLKKPQSKQLLENKNKKEREENTFTNLTPRRGSLPVDYSRPSPRSPKFPLSSPTTPKSTSPTRLNFNSFSPVLEDFEETGEILEGLLNKGRNNSSNKLLNQLLDQKERLLTEKEQEIKRLETEKTQLLSEKETWEKSESKVQQLEKNLLQQSKELEQIKKDLNESNEIIYQETKEKEKLSKFFYESQTNNRKLEQKLTREIDENHWLRNSFQRTKDELTEKVEELTKLKRLGWEEKEQWHKVFSEQEEKYEQEKKLREKKFNKQINNLRTFQLTTDIPPFSIGRGRPLHKKAFSLSLPGSRSASPRGSVYEEEKSPNLFTEISKGNVFHSSPLRNNDIDPLEEVNTSTDDFSQVFEDLLSEVNDFANENTQEQVNQQGLSAELEKLKGEKQHLEKNFKILADEKVEYERILQRFNEKELSWEQKQKDYEHLLQNNQQEKIIQQNEKQKLTEELAEVKYKLAETQKRVKSLEKSEQKTRYQLKNKQENISSLLDGVEQEERELAALIEQTQHIMKINQ